MVKSWSWHKVVLIPKGYGKDFRGIGLVEVMWKDTTGILNRQLTAVNTYHNILHGFNAVRGMGTAILKAKDLHHLTFMR